MKPKQLSRTAIYESPWVNLYIDQVQFPSGEVIDDYHIVDFKKDAVVVLVENEQQEVLFVHSYRYATDSLEWEMPAGLIEAGEDPLETAQREVLEESGYQTTGHRLLCAFNPVNAKSDQVFHFVCCRATSQDGEFDPHEVRTIRWITKDEIKAMVVQGDIRDGSTLLGLLWYLSDLSLYPPS